MMGELKTRGLERIRENQDVYQEIHENAELSLEERNRNLEIIQSLEGVDDDDKVAIEDGKERGKQIADQIAESQMELPKNEVNTQMEGNISEMREYESLEKEDARKVNAMDGNYDGVGAELENKIEESAREFNDIAERGVEIKEVSNEQIDSIIQNMKEDW